MRRSFRLSEARRKSASLSGRTSGEMGSKYLDKLIPSIQLVTLPLLDQLVVQQGNNLELRYLKSVKAGGQKRIKTTRRTCFPGLKMPDWAFRISS